MDEGIITTDKDGMRHAIEAETVVLALGFEPKTVWNEWRVFE